MLLAASLCHAARQPDASPDRVVLNLTTNPATSVAVSWRTAPDVTNSVGEIAVAEPGPHFVSKAVRVAGVTREVPGENRTAAYHEVRFEGLSPRTLYAYRVGDGAHWSEWNHFETAAGGPEPFSFIYFGDAQNDILSHCSRVVRQAFMHCSEADFTLHAGDLVNVSNSDAEWGEWFDTAGWINRTLPVIAAPGNHEYGRGGLTTHWRLLFAMPDNGPPGLEESAYFLDYQGVRFVALNSNEKHAEQAAWMNKVLRDNPNHWTVVTMHHPVYSSTPGRDNRSVRDLWQPVFDARNVDLVLQGHDHTYARTELMKHDPELQAGHQAVQSDSGVVYVVSVCGPKMYGLHKAGFMRQAAANTQLYQIIDVGSDRLRFDAYNAIGQRVDGFTLTKDADGNRRLIEDPRSTGNGH